jgi:hypothetical protein
MAKINGRVRQEHVTRGDDLTLDETIRQLQQLQQLLVANGRNTSTVMVYARGKRITDIRPEDDGSGLDNLDVYLS